MVEAPIRVFIGMSDSEWLPARVLEYSIRLHTSYDVECVHLNKMSSMLVFPKDKKNQPRTPFSFQRFLIPKLCNYHGRAIYLDADMLVFQDIFQLWSTSFEGEHLLYTENKMSGRSPQFSVMLLDCEALEWDMHELVTKLDNGELSYAQLMYEMKVVHRAAARLPWAWNSMEYFDHNVKLLHYTDMNTQPWVSKGNVNGDLWVDYLKRAIKDRFISIEDLEVNVKAGYVRPSLLIEVNTSKSGFSSRIRAFCCDLRFKAPYRALGRSLFARILAKISA